MPELGEVEAVTIKAEPPAHERHDETQDHHAPAGISQRTFAAIEIGRCHEGPNAGAAGRAPAALVSMPRAVLLVQAGLAPEGLWQQAWDGGGGPRPQEGVAALPHGRTALLTQPIPAGLLLRPPDATPAWRRSQTACAVQNAL